MFHVELEDDKSHGLSFRYACRESTHFILVKIAEALVKMPNLVDLRILHGWMKDSDAFTGTRRISEVIRGDYFNLHTLYLQYYHYLEGIISDQPHLRLLGIHSNNRVPKIRQLHQDLSLCRAIPTVFMIADSFEGPTITMFPAFHHPGEALQGCREVATSLSNWSHGFLGKDRYHLSVNLFGTPEGNISLLGEVMEAMATCLQDYFPRDSRNFSVIIHKKSIQKPWRFPEFVKPLALFEDVKTLNVDYKDIDYEKWHQMGTDLEFCMMNKKLGRTWPSLQQILLFCNATWDVLVMKRESNWKVIECTSELEPLEEVLQGVQTGISTGQFVNFGDE